jgi:hypothetical protein
MYVAMNSIVDKCVLVSYPGSEPADGRLDAGSTDAAHVVGIPDIHTSATTTTQQTTQSMTIKPKQNKAYNIYKHNKQIDLPAYCLPAHVQDLQSDGAPVLVHRVRHHPVVLHMRVCAHHAAREEGFPCTTQDKTRQDKT